VPVLNRRAIGATAVASDRVVVITDLVGVDASVATELTRLAGDGALVGAFNGAGRIATVAVRCVPIVTGLVALPSTVAALLTEFTLIRAVKPRLDILTGRIAAIARTCIAIVARFVGVFGTVAALITGAVRAPETFPVGFDATVRATAVTIRIVAVVALLAGDGINVSVATKETGSSDSASSRTPSTGLHRRTISAATIAIVGVVVVTGLARINNPVTTQLAVSPGNWAGPSTGLHRAGRAATVARIEIAIVTRF
jgi:hypothetical protein